jgi:leucyl/phenylalanyl-tRNA--protein transferase
MSGLSTVKDILRPARDGSAALVRPLARPVLTAARRRTRYASPEYFLSQYRAGRFLYVNRWGGSRWIAPTQRALVPIDDDLHVPRSVARLLRRGDFDVRYDTAFAEVLRQCASVHERQSADDSWLTPDAQEVYLHLHDLGFAHSTEAWRDGRLVGGEFGLSINGLYAADSTFYLEPNAGKVAFAHLLQRLRSRGFLLYDTRVISAATTPFGAFTIPRDEYQTLLQEALAADVTFH